MAAINEQARPEHPTLPGINGCRHVYLKAPGSTAQRSRHVMAIHPGWFDRFYMNVHSPAGDVTLSVGNAVLLGVGGAVGTSLAVAVNDGVSVLVGAAVGLELPVGM